MENKFQESLEVISNFIGEYDENTMLDVAMNDLQGLIDNYDKLETKVFDLEQELECIYNDPKQKLEECVTDLDIKNQKLEEELQLYKKALDKACNILCNQLPSYELIEKEFVVKKTTSKEEWKEWILKESDEQ